MVLLLVLLRMLGRVLNVRIPILMRRGLARRISVRGHEIRAITSNLVSRGRARHWLRRSNTRSQRIARWTDENFGHVWRRSRSGMLSVQMGRRMLHVMRERMVTRRV